jgi:aryl-alcohol dehydrogenase-like predicted oxidoreductase
METRKPGRQGLGVSALGLGCMGMGGIYAAGADSAEREATLRRAHAVHPISALQSEYSLFKRGVERGTTCRSRLRENLGATAVRLAACDQFLLDQVFAPGNVAGERYLAAGMAMLDREP